MTKQIFKNKGVIIWIALSALLLAIVITANILAVTIFSSLFDIIFGRPKAILGGGRTQTFVREYDTKEEALEVANALNIRIVEEGVVMLKNEGVLPLEKNSNISVFGKNSVNLVYGGSGSGGGKHENAKTIFESLDAAGFTYNPTLKKFYESSASGEGRSSNPEIEDRGSTGALSTGETPQSSYSRGHK